MKIDRHRVRINSTDVKLHPRDDRPLAVRGAGWLVGFWFGLCITGQTTAADRLGPNADQMSRASVSQPSASQHEKSPAGSASLSQPQAVNLLRRVLAGIVHGPAFDAKVRETVWATGREVVGVGTYEQAGGGTGRFNLQVTMHDGDGKHRLQQISDGRLAWTRTEIAGKVSHRRVDVGRLDEWVQGQVHSTISPGLKVGGWAEMLDTIQRDYLLSVDSAHLKGEAMWVITGELRLDRRDQIMADSKRQAWPSLYPTMVRVAVKRDPDPDTGFGQLLPVHIEFRSDPVASAESTGRNLRRLITLIELYSIRPIAPPPVERFRFENHDAEVIVNETDRYIQLYGVRLTDHQRRQLRR